MARVYDKLVGHKASLSALLRAEATDKLASTLLFVGPAGVGKKLAALALAQAMICENPEPLNINPAGACGICPSCLRVEKEQSESLMLVQPDGASIKIEQARDMLQFLTLRKLGRARVIIIDQAHTLGPQGANALLKSLEEPPSGSHFILITAQPAVLLPTIRSRSQLVRFRQLDKVELKEVLTRLSVKPDEWLLESAQGSVDTALRLSESREDYQELEDAALKYLVRSRTSFPGEEITKLKELMKEKAAQTFFSSLVQNVLRDALRLQAGIKANGVRGSEWEDVARSVIHLTPRELAILADQSLQLESDMARNVDRSLVLENFAFSFKRN